jgi:nucleotidyltransferase/DNA polymerase involved in DNA repair
VGDDKFHNSPLKSIEREYMIPRKDGNLSAEFTKSQKLVVARLMKQTLTQREHDQRVNKIHLDTVKKRDAAKLRIEGLTQSQIRNLPEVRTFRAELQAEVERRWECVGDYVHVDMDMFYCSAELKRSPSLAAHPFAVNNGGVIVAADYKARQYGVRAAIPTSIAFKACPHLRLIWADMPYYARLTARFLETLRKYDPNLRSFGSDEATLNVREYLVGLNSRIRSHNTKGHSSGGITLEQLTRIIWEDVIRSTGMSCSAGAAPTFALAKIAAEQNKPHGVHVMDADRALLEQAVRKLPITEIWGIGAKRHACLQACGINTIGDAYRHLDLLALDVIPKKLLKLVGLACYGMQDAGWLNEQSDAALRKVKEQQQQQMMAATSTTTSSTTTTTTTITMADFAAKPAPPTPAPTLPVSIDVASALASMVKVPLSKKHDGDSVPSAVALQTFVASIANNVEQVDRTAALGATSADPIRRRSGDMRAPETVSVVNSTPPSAPSLEALISSMAPNVAQLAEHSAAAAATVVVAQRSAPTLPVSIAVALALAPLVAAARGTAQQAASSSATSAPAWDRKTEVPLPKHDDSVPSAVALQTFVASIANNVEQLDRTAALGATSADPIRRSSGGKRARETVSVVNSMNTESLPAPSLEDLISSLAPNVAELAERSAAAVVVVPARPTTSRRRSRSVGSGTSTNGTATPGLRGSITSKLPKKADENRTNDSRARTKRRGTRHVVAAQRSTSSANVEEAPPAASDPPPSSAEAPVGDADIPRHAPRQSATDAAAAPGAVPDRAVNTSQHNGHATSATVVAAPAAAPVGDSAASHTTTSNTVTHTTSHVHLWTHNVVSKSKFSTASTVRSHRTVAGSDSADARIARTKRAFESAFTELTNSSFACSVVDVEVHVKGPNDLPICKSASTRLPAPSRDHDLLLQAVEGLMQQLPDLVTPGELTAAIGVSVEFSELSRVNDRPAHETELHGRSPLPSA